MLTRAVLALTACGGRSSSFTPDDVAEYTAECEKVFDK